MLPSGGSLAVNSNQPSNGGEGTPDENMQAKPGTARSSYSVFRSAGLFAGSNLVTMVLGIGGGVLTSRFVDPAVLGQYNAIGLVVGYAPFLHMGVDNGLNRDLPYTLGRGDTKQAFKLAAAAQWWSMLVAIGASVALIFVGFWQAAAGRLDLAVGWWSFGVVVFAALFGQGYLNALFRTSGDFATLARVNLIGSVIALLLVSLVWWFDWWGLCLRGVAVAAVGLALLWASRPIKVLSAFDVSTLLKLAKTGLPIMAVGQAFMWWTTLNSTLVLKYVGTEGLGLYSIANLAGPAVLILSSAFGQVIYPRMSEEFGQSGKAVELVRLAVGPTFVNIAVTGFAVIAAWFALPFFVELVLPKYTGGIEAAQWAVAAAGVMAMAPINNIFNVMKKQGRYGLAIVSGILAYIAVLLQLVSDGIDLVDFSQAFLAGRVVFLALCFVLIGHLVWSDERCA